MSRSQPVGRAFGGAFLTLVAALGAGACSPSSVSAPEPKLSASSVGFGDVALGSQAESRQLELCAPSARGLQIASIQLPAPFRHDLSSAPLAPGSADR